MKCPNKECRTEVVPHRRDCIVCGTDVGFPNIRAAEDAAETTALESRFKTAEKEAWAAKSLTILRRFKRAVATSHAVLCRPLALMNALISSDNAAYSTFYNLVDAEDRLPENNYWDANRQSVDSLLFPYYFQHVRFAALSLDAKGARVFGEYCAVLRDATIKDRASVFEGNPLLLLRDLGLKHGDPIPAGYRAAWNARDLLAVAKLYKQITASTDEAEFPGILLNTSKSAVDYVEVHIYGPIHRRGIQQLSGPIPKRREDRLLFESLKRKAKEAGCTFVDLS